MRHAVIAVLLALVAAAPAAAQGPSPDPSTSPTELYGLDPYNPSDAAFLRNYGAALVAQTPLIELAELNPFNPSEAALLRQIGGALPVWSGFWYPAGALMMPPPAFLPGPFEGRPVETRPAHAPLNFAPFMQNPPLPPAHFDASRIDAFSALKPDQPRPRVCRVRIGNREIIC
jgi:hypothetical protein